MMPRFSICVRAGLGVALVGALGVGSVAGAAPAAGALANAAAPSASAAAPPAAGALRPFGTPAPLIRPLREGVRAPEVRELQVRLRHARFLAAYDAHDRFDTPTREAVRKFQRSLGLAANGVVDQATWDALRQRSRDPTEAELTNTDVGPWFTAPNQPGYVKELQHRLRQLRLYQGALDGELNTDTRAAIVAWRARNGLPASEVVDERTWQLLIRRTHNPRYADLFDAPPASTLAQELDPRCTTGKVVCISKRQQRMSYVVDGQARFTREARFAMPGWDSPEGEFRIWYRNSDTVSRIFGERFPMPYAFFYQGNVAVHFSQDFADKGYAGGSHGCSQLRDYQVAKWLYEQVRVGDKVVVY